MFESKEQPATKFWVSDDGFFCIEQESHEFGKPVTLLLGPDAVDLIRANLEKVVEAQSRLWS
jgi:hypothetical protein